MPKEYTVGESLAITCAARYGLIDGAHHKMWVIDQMCRHILDDNYEEFVDKFNGDWDTGIAP